MKTTLDTSASGGSFYPHNASSASAAPQPAAAAKQEAAAVKQEAAAAKQEAAAKPEHPEEKVRAVAWGALRWCRGRDKGVAGVVAPGRLPCGERGN